ncbi:hypothetical protein BRC86_02665 [Halobacteriales archaeon QS_3_64_16]|nr:MAG: hypothetical protein BRC86_02665 [Halobacteriales archaeon QS_3_64_16]
MTTERSPDTPSTSGPGGALAELALADRPAADDPIHLPLDTVCRLLSNSRRRLVVGEVAALDAKKGTALSNLAERIAAIENGIEQCRVAAGQRKSVYVSLLQCHLPKLDDADVVDWDRRSGAVSRGRSVDELAALIDAIEAVCPT